MLENLFYFCHLKKLVRPETFGPYYVHEVLLQVIIMEIIALNLALVTSHVSLHEIRNN